MPIRDNREYRSAAAPFNAAGDEDGRLILEGYATTFGVPYVMEGSQFDGEPLREVMLASALDGADMSDVILQYDHAGPVGARTSNGTLVVERDAHGLRVRADVTDSEPGPGMYRQVKGGFVTKMSWGFMVPDDGWEYDVATNTRTITRVGKVYDVSLVSIPANQGTDIHARSALDGAIEAMRRELSERAAEEERVRRMRLALLLKL